MMFTHDPRTCSGFCSRALRRGRRTLGLAFALTVVQVFVAAVAQAAPPCDGLGKKCPRAVNAETARGLSLGTGSRASSISTSALAYNPAALVVGRLYHIEAAIDYMPEFDAVALGGAVVDSATAKVGAGFALRGFLSGDEGLGGIDGRLALAFPFSDAISLGVAGRYISITHDDEVPSATAGKTVITTTELAQGFTMDASFRIAPSPMIHLELAAYNFINQRSAQVPIIVGTSVALVPNAMATIGVDFLADMTSYDSPTYSIGGGGELLLGNSVPVRAGYMVDVERALHMVTAGIGYTDRMVGFDLSLQQQVKGGEQTRILGAFRYYVQ